MLVLAIDTALEACSAAIFDSERDEIVARESIPMPRGHAEALMPLVARVMAASGLDFERIDRFAVTTGPGSFTGLRVGIAAARGLGLAAGKPVVGVTTFTAFAAPLIVTDPTWPVVTATMPGKRSPASRSPKPALSARPSPRGRSNFCSRKSAPTPG